MLTEEQVDYILAALDHYYESGQGDQDSQFWDETREAVIECQQ